MIKENETNVEGNHESAPRIRITYSPKVFGQLIGRTTNTLQQWDRDGNLHAHRSPISNRRFYTHDQYLDYIGKKLEMQGMKIA